MHRANREIRHALGNTFTHRRQRGTVLLTLSASLGMTLFLSACGGGDGGDSGGGGLGGRSGLAGSGNSEEVEIDPDAVVDAATKAAALSEDELYAALAAADLENEMALSGPSGLIRELGGEMVARAAWAGVGLQAKGEADAAKTFGKQQTQSAPNIKVAGSAPPGGRSGKRGRSLRRGLARWLAVQRRSPAERYRQLQRRGKRNQALRFHHGRRESHGGTGGHIHNPQRDHEF